MLNNKEQYLWCEKYRPKRVADCILPKDIKDTFQEFVNKREIPNLLLTGGPGVGKTTIAKAMCEEVGCDYLVINGSDERGIDTLRTKIKQYASSVSFLGGRKVLIIDEADYLTPEAQAAMRGAIEEFASNCSFIFTCNFKSRLIDALHSRCSVFEFKIKNGNKIKMATAFMERVENILKLENITYDKAVVAEIIQKHFPDFRRALNEFQRYSVNGKIDVGILAQIADVTIKELMKHMKAKDYPPVRKWVANNSDSDHSKVYRTIFDGLNEFLKSTSIPTAIVLLAKYQYQAAFVADQEINLIAFLSEIMVECEFV